MDFLKEEKSKHTPPPNLGTKYRAEEVQRFIIDCMRAVKVSDPYATALAEVLLAADLRGHNTHGLFRLEMYISDILKGLCAGAADPTVLKESPSTALVDGNNGLGPVVGNFCMDLAIEKAKKTGVAWVCARGSNHYGIAGWYAMRATEQGLLGMSFTNTSSLVAPARGKECVLGTNPIALSAPAAEADSFVLDMATSVVSGGKVEVALKKGMSVPEGWVLDRDGQPTTDPHAAMDGMLLPLGGTELFSDYKGYGLGMMVEIFCGIMSGAPYGPHIRDWKKSDRPAEISHCFVAIDPTFFAPGFQDRMSDLMNYCRNLTPVDPEKPVLVAGDPERLHQQRVQDQCGITYHINLINDVQDQNHCQAAPNNKPRVFIESA